MLDKIFSLKKNNTSIPKEIIAGLTTFSAMSYILMVNPAILSATGMDKMSLITVTALASALGCIFMAIFANLPIALAPAMGSNSFFAFSICIGMGIRWQDALSLIFYNGILFLLISVTGIRSKFMSAVPKSLQIGLQVGIGLFITFLGMQSAKLVVSNPNTIVALGNLHSPEVIFTLVTFALMCIFYVKKFSGGIFASILIMSVVGFFIQSSSGSYITNLPENIISLPSGISSTFMQLDLLYPFYNFKEALPLILILLVLDLFDTLGTAIAMGKAVGILDKDGKLPKMGSVFLADSLATITGAILGTSTTGAYVESATGIHSGGRTGLTSITVAVLFLCSLIFTPIISIVPAQASSPALILVGILMFTGLKDIDFSDFTNYLPCVFCIIMIAFSFNITEGLAFGMISYVILMSLSKRIKEIKSFTWLLFAILSTFLIYC